MDVSNGVADYIQKSILTAQGDIVVRDVVGPDRLAIGTRGSILRVNSSDNSLEYLDHGNADEFLVTNSSGNDIEFTGLGSILNSNMYSLHNSTLNSRDAPDILLSMTTTNCVQNDIILGSVNIYGWNYTTGQTVDFEIYEANNYIDFYNYRSDIITYKKLDVSEQYSVNIPVVGKVNTDGLIVLQIYVNCTSRIYFDETMMSVFVLKQ
jgi:hypothetical protein